MNKYKQHIPNFCSGFEPAEFEYNTDVELLEHPEIKRSTEYDDFYRFSYTPKEGPYQKYHTLILECKNGYEWWVKGFIEGDEPKTLPIWEAKYKEKT